MSRLPRPLVALLCGVALLASGCVYQGYHRVTFRNPSLVGGELSEHEAEHVFTLFGLVDSSGTYLARAIDVSEICPGGVAELSHYQTAPQASWIPIVPLLIAPLVSPSTIEYRCVQE
jgi:ABC-type Fe3+-siderophore transport system permease subunit